MAGDAARTLSPLVLAGPRLAGQEDLLGPAALEFLVELHRTFEARRQERLAARRQRQARFDAGELPDFREDTRAIREGDWTVAPAPAALTDRRVEITGPVDPKMVINALNSGASCYMADFEDSTSPTWENLLVGQRALRKATNGTLDWMAPDGSKHYVLDPTSTTTLIVRPRGWHLDEKNVLVDGERLSASLFDLGLFAFHNAAALQAKDRGPYFYLPKLQSMEEAALWNDALDFIEARLGLPAAPYPALLQQPVEVDHGAHQSRLSKPQNTPSMKKSCSGCTSIGAYAGLRGNSR